MKVLYATMQLGRGYGQGTERYVAMLSEGLRERGHETLALAGDPERRGARLKLGEFVDGDARLLHYPSHGHMSVRGVSPARLERLLRDVRPDVVHLANPGHIGVGLLEAARRAGIPTAVTVMDFWWLCPKHTLQHYSGSVCDADVTWRDCLHCLAAGHQRAMARRVARVPVVRAAALPLLFFGRSMIGGLPIPEIGRWMRRQSIVLGALDGADAVIFASKTARSLIGPRISRPAMHEIPYGLEPRWFARGKREPADAGNGRLSPHSPRDARDVTLGYAGALAEHKGVHLILDALRRLGWSDTRLRIAGGGDALYEDRLRRLAAGLNVDFVGRVPSAEMPAYLCNLDLLIVPSTWPENLPIACLEAQAVGVEVLASRAGGIAEMIPDADHLFDVGSAESLADRLAAWRSGRLSRTAARVSTADEMIARTLAVYHEVRRVVRV